MNLAMEWLKLLLPWLAILGLTMVLFRLIRWAKNQKAGVLLIGAFLQMVLPDPYAERTIRIVEERKQETIKAADENGAPPSDMPD